jgi:hypothetical protein
LKVFRENMREYRQLRVLSGITDEAVKQGAQEFVLGDPCGLYG